MYSIEKDCLSKFMSSSESKVVSQNFLRRCTFGHAEQGRPLDENIFTQLVDFQRETGDKLLASISFKAQGKCCRVMDKISKATEEGILLRSGATVPYFALFGIHLVNWSAN